MLIFGADIEISIEFDNFNIKTFSLVNNNFLFPNEDLKIKFE